jgi:hypothetical protein
VNQNRKSNTLLLNVKGHDSKLSSSEDFSPENLDFTHKFSFSRATPSNEKIEALGEENLMNQT